MTTDGPVEEDNAVSEDESVAEEDCVGKGDAVIVTTEGVVPSLMVTDGLSTENSTVGKLAMLND